ncbi:nitroreductase family protein [Mycolicibacterium bacteremicum]|nr:nitroreductase family protein [Mycolicibacterium bacteremicum]
MAHGALAAYFAHFDASGVPAPKWLTAELRTALLPDSPDLTLGGTKPRTVASFPSVEAFDNLIESRESVRHFAKSAVALSDIEEAARIADNSPSVCNRQGSRIRVFARGPAADALLKYQNGNTGFGADASFTLLITHDLETMVAPSERNQAFVDGGLYAMTLVYALHARGIGTCCLNWSTTQAKDRGLRREIGLPPNEVVIMMVAVGYPAEDSRVAVSSIRQDRYAVGMAAPSSRPRAARQTAPRPAR